MYHNSTIWDHALYNIVYQCGAACWKYRGRCAATCANTIVSSHVKADVMKRAVCVAVFSSPSSRVSLKSPAHERQIPIKRQPISIAKIDNNSAVVSLYRYKLRRKILRKSQRFYFRIRTAFSVALFFALLAVPCLSLARRQDRKRYKYCKKFQRSTAPFRRLSCSSY